MVRASALVSLVLLIGAVVWLQRPRDDRPRLEVKYRYLVVSIDGPPEWEKQHRFALQWQGETIPLPVVFRTEGWDNDFRMLAGPEIDKYLEIGEYRVAVTAEPKTDYRVRNELPVTVIPEESSRRGAAGMSIATWVTVTPPDQPGMVNPTRGADEVMTAGQKLQKPLQALIAAGRVIDVQRLE